MACDYLSSLSHFTEVFHDRNTFSIAIVIATVVIFAWHIFPKVLKSLATKNSIPKRRRSESTDNEDPDIVIVGSGILGSSLAAVLGRDGWRVTVVERDLREPDRIVGELLQPGGCQALRKLGLESCLEGLDAQWTSGYVIQDLDSASSVHIPYPSPHEGAPPTMGVAFKHGRFVSALRSAAQADKNVTYIEGTAVKLEESEDGVVTGVTYRDKETSQMKTVSAPLTVVADGLFSKFRKDLADAHPQTTSYFVGFLMSDCPQVRSGHAELVLTDPSPVLVYKITSKYTRVLVDLKGPLPKNLKQHLVDNFAHLMPEHMRDPFIDGVCNEPVRYMPCTYVVPTRLQKPGAMLLGDAFNTRHPLTGGGMSVAFNDVHLWRELLQEIPSLKDHDAVAKAGRQFDWRRKQGHSFVVNVLAQALYELFSAEDEDLKDLKRACFAYFKLGGQCVSGPVGLLSILTPRPMTLISHFFAVALYAVLQKFRTKGWAVHSALYSSSKTFGKACKVILPLIWSEVKIYII